MVNKFISYFKRMFDENITVYSAYASFYMVISFVPFLILFLMIGSNFINFTSNDFAAVATNHLPVKVINLISYLIDEILGKDFPSKISIPVVMLVWTSSRSVVAIIKGLDKIYEVETEGGIKRGVIKLNLNAVFYTAMFLVAIMFSLIAMVFGNVLADILASVFPVAINLIDTVLSFIPIISILVLTFFFSLLYTFLPRKKQSFRRQLPGAVFASSGWMIFSMLFSVYIDNFSDRSYLYGSLTALILLMLWIYSCMIFIFLGGKINHFLSSEDDKVEAEE